MTIAIDPQITGAYDDGSRDGVVRARIVRANIVRVPFREVAFYVETQGSSTATLNYSNNWLGNLDGSCSSMVFNTPQVVPGGSGVVAAGAKIWVPFYGRVFGVRWRQDTPATATFSVKVDGVAYPIISNSTSAFPYTEGVTGIHPEGMAIVADDLADDFLHWAEIQLSGVITAGTQSLVVWGMWLDGRYYEQLPHTITQINTGQLTIAKLIVPRTVNTGSGGYNTARYIRQIVYYNTDTVARLVTLQLPNAGGTGSMVDIAQKSLAANETWTFDFLAPAVFQYLSATNALQHYSDADNKVTYTVFGGV